MPSLFISPWFFYHSFIQRVLCQKFSSIINEQPRELGTNLLCGLNSPFDLARLMQHTQIKMTSRTRMKISTKAPMDTPTAIPTTLRSSTTATPPVVGRMNVSEVVAGLVELTSTASVVGPV